MNIQINGEKEALSVDALTVSQLLTIKEVKMPDMVSVELNGDIVDRDAFDTTPVSDGDEVEFLYFMGGGQFA
jgi:sulfur carrier protein